MRYSAYYVLCNAELLVHYTRKCKCLLPFQVWKTNSHSGFQLENPPSLHPLSTVIYSEAMIQPGSWYSPSNTDMKLWQLLLRGRPMSWRFTLMNPSSSTTKRVKNRCKPSGRLHLSSQNISVLVSLYCLSSWNCGSITLCTSFTPKSTSQNTIGSIHVYNRHSATYSKSTST